MNKVKYAMLNAGTILLENQNKCKSEQVKVMKEALSIISSVLYETEKGALEKQLEQLNSYIDYYSKLKEFDAASDIQKEIQAVEEKLKTLEENK